MFLKMGCDKSLRTIGLLVALNIRIQGRNLKHCCCRTVLYYDMAAEEVERKSRRLKDMVSSQAYRVERGQAT